MKEEKGKVRFVRIRGRIVPIKRKKKEGPKLGVQGGLNVGASVGAAYGTAYGAFSNLKEALSSSDSNIQKKYGGLSSKNITKFQLKKMGKYGLVGAGIGTLVGAGLLSQIKVPSEGHKKSLESSLPIQPAIATGLYLYGGGRIKGLSKAFKSRKMLSGFSRKFRGFKARKKVIKTKGNVTHVKFGKK